MTPGRTLELGVVHPLVRRLPGAPDPLTLYRALTGGGLVPHTFLLESADRTSHIGERSLIGVRAALRLTADRTTVRVEALSPNGSAALDWLATRLPGAARGDHGRSLRLDVDHAPAVGAEADRFRRPSPFDLVRLLGFGPKLDARPNSWCHLLVGAFGYDAIDYFEVLPPGRPDPLGQPLIEVWLPDRLIVVDHVRQTTSVVVTTWGGAEPATRYHDATHELERLIGVITRHSALGARRSATPPVTGYRAAVDLDDDQYASVVRRLQEHLRAGDAYQLVPSRTFSLPCDDPLGAYRELRARNPSPYLFLLAGPDRVLLGASPETCLRVEGRTRRASILPIAGTAARARHPDGSLDLDADTRNEVALRLDGKEAAEHLMLVDLARNDIARISEPGTRQVSRLLEVERYSHVMHLVSEVSGTLRPEVDAIEAYAATMNMGTLVGAPKVRAAELLREVEPSRRGFYGGGVGYLRSDGTLETAIVIRSAVIQDGTAFVRAGAGVVLDSDPHKEADETRRKARAVIESVAAAGVAVAAPAAVSSEATDPQPSAECRAPSIEQ